jgi:Primase C terminal 2 (PriCT-2)/Protein of unknown function (DUF3987)/Bifunctional DNA primase/polymerase, N-terminal
MRNYMGLYGQTVLENGFPIIPIVAGDKIPGRYNPGTGTWLPMPEWPRFGKRHAHDLQVSTWGRWPGCGVGIPTGRVVAVDIDITDELLAARVMAVIRSHLGESDLVRVGLSPKRLVLYRTETPFKKLRVGPIEVLAEGQQFVAYGQHPKTGKDYVWTHGREPFDTDIGDLLEVTEAQVRAALEAAALELPQEQRGRPAPTASDEERALSEDGLLGSLEAVRDAVQHITNDDVHWDEWNRVGMAIFGATNGAGWEIFEAWSAKSAKYNPVATKNRWQSYRRSPPKKIGFGTLCHLAFENGWDPPADLAFHEEPDDNVDVDAMIEKIRALRVAPDVVEDPKGDVDNALIATMEKSPENALWDEWATSPSLVGQIASWIIQSAILPQPILAVSHTIATLGALFGRRYRSDYLGTLCNITMVAVAKQGFGKDHSRACLRTLLWEAGLQKYLGEEDFTSSTAVMSMLEEFPSRICAIDEYGKFLQAVGSRNASTEKKAITSIFLKLYSESKNPYYTGTAYADRKDRPTVVICHPNLNIYGTTTGEALAKAMTDELVNDGTFSRMLLITPTSRVPELNENPIGSPDRPPPALVDAMKQLKIELESKVGADGEIQEGKKSLGDIGLPGTKPNFILVEWTEDAKEAHKAIFREQLDLISGKTNQTFSRLGENIAKVAMIEAIARDRKRPRVTLPLLEKAARLVRWCAQCGQAWINMHVADDKSEAERKSVKRMIADAGEGGIDRSALLRDSRGMKAKVLDDWLRHLMDAGEITQERSSRPGPGRKAVIYKIAKGK